MSPQIIAKVEQPQKEACFIITSYSSEFDQVSHLICLAAADPLVRLTGLRADELAKGSEFPKTVFHAIRAARLVVVVYMSDPKTGQMRGNVIYELGLASSLRKPILIITTEEDQKKIPSDASHLTYHPCKLSDLNNWTEQTKKELTFEMKKILEAAAGPFTDLRFEDTYSELSEIPTAQLWKGLNRILESTTDVGRHLSPAQRDFQTLCNSAHVLFGDPGQGTTNFIQGWRHYSHHLAAPLTHPLTRLVNAYTEFMQKFPEFLELPAKPRRSMDIHDTYKVPEFFKAVQQQVQELSEIHQRVNRELGDFGNSLWKDKQGAVYSDCTRIGPMLDILNNDVQRLLWNVMGVVATNIELRISAKKAGV